MWPFASEKNPKRPSFRGAPLYTHKLPGLTLEFRAPESNGILGERQELFREITAFDDANLESIFKGQDQDSMLLRWLYAGHWVVRGAPLFSPSVGEVTCLVGVVKSGLTGVTDSLFEADHLAKIVGKWDEISTRDDYFNYPGFEEWDFSDKVTAGKISAVNSQWVLHQDLPFFYTESFGTQINDHFHLWHMPIDDTHCLRIHFGMDRTVNNASSYYRSDQRVPIKPFREAMWEFMSHLQLSLSSELTHRLEKLRNELRTSAPRLEPSLDYTYTVKHATQKASVVGYTPPKGEPREISPQEASRFVDELIKHRPVPGSLGFDGPVTYVHHRGNLTPVPLEFRQAVPPPWE